MTTRGAARRLALIAALSVVLGACGSSESTTQTEKSGDDAGYDGGSYPLPGCSLDDPASCTYEGFDPSVDGFGFENWGEAGVLGATEMIALFGRKEVCANGGSADCVLYPAAQQWVDQVNEAMSGGHCEGMAVLSRLIYDGGVDLADLDAEAGSTFDLSRENPAVLRAIEYWWATQMVQPVQEAFQSYQQFEPSEIAATLGERKARAILATGAALAVTGNIGCLTQLRMHLRRLGSAVPVRHTMQVLRDASLPPHM